MTTLHIKSGKERSILRKHPWIFSGAISRIDGMPKDGDVVTIADHQKKTLGFAHFQNGSIIARMLSFDNTPPDIAFYKSKLSSAWQLRKSLGFVNNVNTNIFRLIHGEGDFLPGLIIDHYDGHLVMQCHSIGMYKQADTIKDALVSVLGNHLKSIYLKCTGTLPKEYTEYGGDSYIFGHAETPVIALENGNAFYIDWIKGQKTGFFIDQRENRELLAKYSTGKKILNTFCYSGGFSVYSLNRGATLVHSVDSSQKAIDLTNQNIVLGKFSTERHQSFVADTMDFIRELKEDYDIIILDPPAFAKHRNAKHSAVQGYKRLNAHAIRQIKPGGMLFTFSCSQVIDKDLFTNTVIAAAIEANRPVRILHQLHQPADHPINANHPEGEYLKGLVIQVD